MATGYYEVTEVRMLCGSGDPLNHVFVHVKADENCPHTVGGWYHKAFAPNGEEMWNATRLEIGSGEYLTEWGRRSPPA